MKIYSYLESYDVIYHTAIKYFLKQTVFHNLHLAINPQDSSGIFQPGLWIVTQAIMFMKENHLSLKWPSLWIISLSIYENVSIVW